MGLLWASQREDPQYEISIDLLHLPAVLSFIRERERANLFHLPAVEVNRLGDTANRQSAIVLPRENVSAHTNTKNTTTSIQIQKYKYKYTNTIILPEDNVR